MFPDSRSGVTMVAHGDPSGDYCTYSVLSNESSNKSII